MPFEAWDNPMGTDGFEFIEYAAPDPAALGELFERMGFKADRAAPPQERAAVPPGRRSTSSSTPSPIRSRSASRACTARASARSPSACRTRKRPTSARSSSAPGASPATPGPGELNIPAIKGIGDSLIYFVDRWRGKNGAKEGEIGNIGFYDVDFEPLPGARALTPAGPRPDLHRPPDAQRAPRPHGGVGRLLRAPVQLPRDPLLRHRGPGHRA